MHVRGRPFEPGNKLGMGRPKGSKNKLRPNARKLLVDYSELLMRVGIRTAVTGDDPSMLRGLIAQILRLERETPARVGKLSVDTPTEVKESYDRILKLLRAGKMDVEDALGFCRLLELGLKALFEKSLDQRLKNLEANEKLQDVRGPIGALGEGTGNQDPIPELKPS